MFSLCLFYASFQSSNGTDDKQDLIHEIKAISFYHQQQLVFIIIIIIVVVVVCYHYTETTSSYYYSSLNRQGHTFSKVGRGTSHHLLSPPSLLEIKPMIEKHFDFLVSACLKHILPEYCMRNIISTPDDHYVTCNNVKFHIQLATVPCRSS